ncbi:MAG: indoleacetamide hydrolase [Burkholderiales bacterium]|nr:indoleacetamide hydrolase [Burkholderiales bacterium]
MAESTMREMTAAEALSRIRSGRLFAEAYVGAMLDRAERLKSLDALITIDRAGAIEQAKKVDALRASGAPLPVLAGLPIVVKDNINTRDLPTTGGTAALHGVRPTANAPTLQKLIDAGAIVIAKANLHELAFGITSTNLTSFAGPVKNPYDRTRIPGGSSGGTAAAIAARIVPAGLGTDTGGSTRIPAALCGIVGLRPSVGDGGAERRYDGAGVLPISHTRDTVGPMGRTVGDVALLDAIITGEPPIFSAASLPGLRIGIPASFWAGLEPQLAAVMAQARARLASAGVLFVEVDLAGLAALNDKVSFPIALHEPIADIPAYLAATGVSGIGLREIAAGVASPDVKGAFGAIQGDVAGPGYADAIRVFRPQMQRLYADYFKANRLEAMMFPTTVAAAIAIDPVAGSGKFMLNGKEVETFATFIRNTDPGSNAGIPGLALPAGMTPGGLPVGLELDGPLGTDRRLIAIGLAFENVLGTLRPPSGI